MWGKSREIYIHNVERKCVFLLTAALDKDDIIQRAESVKEAVNYAATRRKMAIQLQKSKENIRPSL